MPVSPVPPVPADVARYDVIGFVEADFVVHVGLARQAYVVGEERIVPLAHMAPPFMEDLQAEVALVAKGELTESEQEKIRTFLEGVRDEYGAQSLKTQIGLGRAIKLQYCIYPHTLAALPVTPGRRKFPRRFSCVGLVIEAYATARIQLLDLGNLPPVSLEELVTAYRWVEEDLRDPERRAGAGLVNEEPWPVVLPGYVIHSLRRPRAEIKSETFAAKAGDQYYPSRRLNEG